MKLSYYVVKMNLLCNICIQEALQLPDFLNPASPSAERDAKVRPEKVEFEKRPVAGAAETEKLKRNGYKLTTNKNKRSVLCFAYRIEISCAQVYGKAG